MQFKQFCIFCGHNKNNLSKEHIFPNWLGLGNFVDMGVNSFSIHFKQYRYDTESGKRISIEKRRPIIRDGDPHKQKLKVVCENCNNKWMSDIQDEAKPLLVSLLNGELKTLNQDQRNLLTKWVTMFTMVSEFINRETVVISQEARSAFKENRVIPKELMVSIGLYTGNKMRGSIPYLLANSKAESPAYQHGKEEEYDTRISMFSIGKALFIVSIMPEFMYSRSTLVDFRKLEQLGINFISGPLKSPIISFDKEIDNVALYQISLSYFDEAAFAYYPDPIKGVDVHLKAYLSSEDRARMNIIHEDDVNVYALTYLHILPTPL